MVLIANVLLFGLVFAAPPTRALKATDLLSGAIAFMLEGGSFQAPAGGSAGGGKQPTTVFGPNVRLSDEPLLPLFVVAQTEPTNTASPANRDNVVAGFHDPFTHPERPGEIISCAFTTSFDGGATWTKFGAVPMTVPGDTCSDPALSSDHVGNHFYAYLSVRDACFAGAPGCTSDIAVSRSSDAGRSFGPAVAAFRGTPSLNFPDKEYVWADSSATSPHRGNVYVTFTLFDILGTLDFITGCQIMFARSANGGLSFEPAIPISPHFACTGEGPGGNVVQGSNPGAGTDGTVYVAYYDSGEDGWGPGLGGVGTFRLMVARSDDGGKTFSSPTVAATLNELSFTLPPTSFRAWSSMFPVIRAFDNLVYVVAATNPAGPDDADIVLLKSGNRGKTWDKPARVNDDATTNDQFFPWIALQPDGDLHVIFGDRRDDPKDGLYHIYHTALSKGSGRFRANVRVTDAVSDPVARDLEFIGDYFNIAASDIRVHAVWTDNRAASPTFRFNDIFTAAGTTP